MAPRDRSTRDATDHIRERRRGLAIEIVGSASTSIDLYSLASEIASLEDRPPEDVERIATTLHHIHLPKLAATGELDYDPTTNRIDP